MSNKPPSAVEMYQQEAEELGSCPFCGIDIASSQDPPSIIHQLPMCDQFKRLDVLSYLAKVREARSNVR